jgi:transposase
LPSADAPGCFSALTITPALPANLFSLIASCELHGLDPEAYLLDIIHVLPYWPRARYLDLAPKYWAATRARIPEAQLAVEIGDITVPPPLPPQEQPASR